MRDAGHLSRAPVCEAAARPLAHLDGKKGKCCIFFVFFCNLKKMTRENKEGKGIFGFTLTHTSHVHTHVRRARTDMKYSRTAAPCDSFGPL